MKPVIIKADKSNTNWKYMALCKEHSFVLEAQTKKELLNYETKEFCNECNEAGA